MAVYNDNIYISCLTKGLVQYKLRDFYLLSTPKSLKTFGEAEFRHIALDMQPICNAVLSKAYGLITFIASDNYEQQNDQAGFL